MLLVCVFLSQARIVEIIIIIKMSKIKFNVLYYCLYITWSSYNITLHVKLIVYYLIMWYFDYFHYIYLDIGLFSPTGGKFINSVKFLENENQQFDLEKFCWI